MKRKLVFLIFTYLVLASCTNGQVNTRERQIRFPKYEKFVCLGEYFHYTGINLYSFNVGMSQYLRHTFHRNALAEQHGRKCMPGKMEVQILLDTAKIGNFF